MSAAAVTFAMPLSARATLRRFAAAAAAATPADTPRDASRMRTRLFRRRYLQIAYRAAADCWRSFSAASFRLRQPRGQEPMALREIMPPGEPLPDASRASIDMPPRHAAFSLAFAASCAPPRRLLLPMRVAALRRLPRLPRRAVYAAAAVFAICRRVLLPFRRLRLRAHFDCVTV